MEQVMDFLKTLMEKLEDVNWSFSEIVEYKEVEEDEKIYAELSNGLTLDKQDDWYINQSQHGEDFFSGIIIYPLIYNKGLLIHYSC